MAVVSPIAESCNRPGAVGRLKREEMASVGAAIGQSPATVGSFRRRTKAMALVSCNAESGRSNEMAKVSLYEDFTSFA